MDFEVSSDFRLFQNNATKPAMINQVLEQKEKTHLYIPDVIFPLISSYYLPWQWYSLHIHCNCCIMVLASMNYSSLSLTTKYSHSPNTINYCTKKKIFRAQLHCGYLPRFIWTKKYIKTKTKQKEYPLGLCMYAEQTKSNHAAVQTSRVTTQQACALKQNKLEIISKIDETSNPQMAST